MKSLHPASLTGVYPENLEKQFLINFVLHGSLVKRGNFLFFLLAFCSGLLAEVAGVGDRVMEPIRIDTPYYNPPVNNPLNHNFGSSLNDPHGVVHEGKVYLFAGHDDAPENTTFVMHDWWVWSSENLVDWKLESKLDPKDTYLKRPFHSCWAPFGVFRNGKCYFYFSVGGAEIGVAVADSVAGPWRDPLGKALVPANSLPTSIHDPDILKDDDGEFYMVFGTWDYYIARLNEDMVSFAEKPRLIEIDRNYGPYGEGRTDDKPSLHKRNGIYYLSWSSFYATSDSIYGPYKFKGSVIKPSLIDPAFRKGHIWVDRHGNFFEFNNQWYYVTNDASQPGFTGFYRASILTYLHFMDDGTMAPIRIDALGVGQYDAACARIEAENYFKSVRAEKRECPAGGFEMRGLRAGSELYYPRIHHFPEEATLKLSLASGSNTGGLIEVREDGPGGPLLGTCEIRNTGGWDQHQTFACPLASKRGTKSLCLIVTSESNEEVARLDWFSLEGKSVGEGPERGTP